MSTVTLSAVRTRFATAVATITGMTESRNPFEDVIRAPQSVAQKRYWIGITGAIASDDGRQNVSVGVQMDTTVSVKFAYRLRPKDQVVDYGEAMDQAELVIKKLTARGAPLSTDLQIRFSQLTTDITTSGEYIIPTLEFSVIHFLPLV
jgi:hypothetical protein